MARGQPLATVVFGSVVVVAGVFSRPSTVSKSRTVCVRPFGVFGLITSSSDVTRKWSKHGGCSIGVGGGTLLLRLRSCACPRGPTSQGKARPTKKSRRE